MKFLVTGGAGFIASHVVDRLINEGHPNLPLSPYGINKFTVEKYLYMYGESLE